MDQSSQIIASGPTPESSKNSPVVFVLAAVYAVVGFFSVYLLLMSIFGGLFSPLFGSWSKAILLGMPLHLAITAGSIGAAVGLFYACVKLARKKIQYALLLGILPLSLAAPTVVLNYVYTVNKPRLEDAPFTIYYPTSDLYEKRTVNSVYEWTTYDNMYVPMAVKQDYIPVSNRSSWLSVYQFPVTWRYNPPSDCGPYLPIEASTPKTYPCTQIDTHENTPIYFIADRSYPTLYTTFDNTVVAIKGGSGYGYSLDNTAVFTEPAIRFLKTFKAGVKQ